MSKFKSKSKTAVTPTVEPTVEPTVKPTVEPTVKPTPVRAKTPGLADELANFYGTSGYHRWSILSPNFVLTDGAKYLADNAGHGAYWLMDLIASHLISCQEEFVVVQLRKPDNAWIVTLDDGDGNVFASQRIAHSDFPFNEFKLYVCQQDDLKVIMLTTEY